MNPCTKTLLLAKDSASLISLYLWLEQFGDIEVVGSVDDATMIDEAIDKLSPDVLIVDISSPARDVLALRDLQRYDDAPAIVTVNQRNRAYLDSILAAEFDAHVGPRTSLKEISEIIKKAANKRRVAITASHMPRTKAG